MSEVVQTPLRVAGCFTLTEKGTLGKRLRENGSLRLLLGSATGKRSFPDVKVEVWGVHQPRPAWLGVLWMRAGCLQLVQGWGSGHRQGRASQVCLGLGQQTGAGGRWGEKHRLHPLKCGLLRTSLGPLARVVCVRCENSGYISALSRVCHGHHVPPWVRRSVFQWP